MNEPVTRADLEELMKRRGGWIPQVVGILTIVGMLVGGMIAFFVTDAEASEEKLKNQASHAEIRRENDQAHRDFKHNNDLQQIWNKQFLKTLEEVRQEIKENHP
jgi:gas vesicle protein